ncbi:YecA/YgfB family protein [Butyrivibrio sp. MC2013]|uniref:YecA/YgfB family protein n=1 Tax=Butyrivibrio sp. MC2013 TaxID=1280686 RepID=UPI00040779A2|nr:SEC-C domain-containing protein [Butyrivibrio sp. MC2013]
MNFMDHYTNYINSGDTDTRSAIMSMTEVVKKDVEAGDKERCREDMRRLYAYLNGSDIDEDSQKSIISSVMVLSSLQDRAWFRSEFAGYLSFISNDFYLKTAELDRVLDAARASEESYRFFDDKEMDIFIKRVIPLIADHYYGEGKAPDNSGDYYINKWYLLKYMEEEQGDLALLQKDYPGLYKCVEDIGNTSTSYRSLEIEYLKKIKGVTAPGIDLYRRLISSYYDNMQKIYPQRKDEYDQKRILWDKASGNDHCPCGSGRKFKKCHGNLI